MSIVSDLGDQFNDCTALEPYEESTHSKHSSNGSRKSFYAGSLPYRWVPESSPNISDTASSIASLPSISSRAPSEISLATTHADNRALSMHSANDYNSSVSSAPSRGTSSYGRARVPVRRGQPRNTRGGAYQRPIDRPDTTSTIDSTVAKSTGPAYEPLMGVEEYIEQFELGKNYPHKRLKMKPEKLFRIDSKLFYRNSKLFYRNSKLFSLILYVEPFLKSSEDSYGR